MSVRFYAEEGYNSEHSPHGELLMSQILCCSWALWTLKTSSSSYSPLVYCNLIPLVQLAGKVKKRPEVISVTELALGRE